MVWSVVVVVMVAVRVLGGAAGLLGERCRGGEDVVVVVAAPSCFAYRWSCLVLC